VDFITSKFIVKGQYLSFSHVASLAIRVQSLKHEHSNTRRISQDLHSRKPVANREPQLSTSPSTLSGGNSPIRTRPISPTLPRRTSADSAIPETPQHLGQPDKDRVSSTDSHALTEATSNLFLDTAGLPRTDVSQIRTTRPATSEQIQQSDTSSASQIDDDIRRRSSLENMVSP
jgi:hypothetical protein